MSLSSRIVDVLGRIAQEFNSLRAALSGKSNLGHVHDWPDIVGKPTIYPPSAHTHNASDIALGTLSSARLPEATTTTIGAVEKATVAEASGGTDDVRYITSYGMKSAINSTTMRPPRLFNGAVNPSGTSGYVIGDVFINTATGDLWVNE